MELPASVAEWQGDHAHWRQPWRQAEEIDELPEHHGEIIDKLLEEVSDCTRNGSCEASIVAGGTAATC